MTPSTLALARRVRALLAESCDPDRLWDALIQVGAGSGLVLVELQKAAGGTLLRWLDAPARTHADVLALLDRVIAEGER